MVLRIIAGRKKGPNAVAGSQDASTVLTMDQRCAAQPITEMGVDADLPAPTGNRVGGKRS